MILFLIFSKKHCYDKLIFLKLTKNAIQMAVELGIVINCKNHMYEILRKLVETFFKLRLRSYCKIINSLRKRENIRAKLGKTILFKNK